MTTINVYSPKKKTGTVDSLSWKVPDNITGNIVLSATLPLSELQDVTNLIKFESFVSIDNVIWEPFFAFTWQGGNYTNRLGQILKGPGVSFDGKAIAGKYVKIKITLNKQMTIGMDIDN